MARVTHVKSARQRYAMVPVLDDEGNVKRTPVMKRDGVTPKTTKTGREVTMKVTVQDRSKPLPNLRCDFPGCAVDGGEILPGTSYKHITPRSGPYGGTQRNRHAGHPDWNVWEYSYSRSAQVARTVSEIHAMIDDYTMETADDFDNMRQQAQDMAQEQLDEQEEALGNMPEQLQDGSQASEYRDALESWVDEIGNADAPDEGEAFEDCDECDGTGEAKDSCDNCDGTGTCDAGTEDEDDCDECSGTGEIEDSCSACDDGKTDVLNEDWVEEAKDTLREAVDGCEI